MLLSIAKLQNLKAIHNPLFLLMYRYGVVINRKTTKFESNSQREKSTNLQDSSCYQSQNYKIWKQFTTSVLDSCLYSLLLSIAKLQNLKAIHNNCILYSSIALVVINRKTTKFESNSQLPNIALLIPSGCYQSQNYKIWKQFTTFV